MALRINASIAVILPDKPEAMASTLAEVAAAYSAFLTALSQHSPETEFSVNEVRTPVSRRKRKKAVAAVAVPVDTAAAA